MVSCQRKKGMNYKTKFAISKFYGFNKILIISKQNLLIK